MHRLEFQYSAGQPANARAVVGVVSSGDLEMLLQPGMPGQTRIRLTTAVDGHAGVWQAQLDRLFGDNAPTRPAVDIDINDCGATPGVVALRVAQAFEALDRAAAGGRR